MATRWQPDTHNDGNPNAPTVDLTFYMDGDNPVCTEAIVDGVKVDNPQEVFDQVCAENRLKNTAYGFVYNWLPLDYKKPVLDEDGDPVEGEYQLKVKHPILWDFGKLGDGVVSIFVEGLKPEHEQPLKDAIAAEFGDSVVYER